MDRRGLVSVLRKAHAGELAAALAYAGHWRSLPPGEERSTIQRIEREELSHRVELGRMLGELAAEPSAVREALFRIVGMTIGLLCRVGGWLIPMYGAGRLEAGNVLEYEFAAVLADAAGYRHFVGPLLRMSDVEAEHERFFRENVSGHRLSGIVPMWRAPRASTGRRRAEPVKAACVDSPTG